MGRLVVIFSERSIVMNATDRSVGLYRVDLYFIALTGKGENEIDKQIHHDRHIPRFDLHPFGEYHKCSDEHVTDANRR